jgi:CBS domain-containing protein
VVAEGLDPRSTRVDEIMSRDLVTSRPDEDLEEALEAMAEHQVRRVPVVNENGKLVGIISQADVFTRGKEKQGKDVVKEISKERKA